MRPNLLAVQGAVFGISLLLSCVLSGCRASVSNASIPTMAHSTVEVNNYGTDKHLHRWDYKENPERVIVVHQNAVEALLEIGAGNQISAVADVDLDRISEKYRTLFLSNMIQVPYQLSRENALMIQPQLIVGWYSTFTRNYLGSTDFWQARGVNTYILPASFSRDGEGQTLEGEYRFLHDMGRIFGKEDRAKEIIQKMQEEIDYVVHQSQTYTHKPRCLVLEFEGNAFRAYGETTLAGNILMHLGIPLAAKGNHLSYEELIMSNPDVVFLVNLPETEEGGREIVERLYRMPAFSGIKAVQDKRVYSIPLYEMYCSGIRSYEGILTFAKGAYPEIMKDNFK